MARMIKLPGRNVSVNPYAVAAVSLCFTDTDAPTVYVELTNDCLFDLTPDAKHPYNTENARKAGLELYEQVVGMINERIG